jgi:hypothetical protein
MMELEPQVDVSIDIETDDDKMDLLHGIEILTLSDKQIL